MSSSLKTDATTPMRSIKMKSLTKKTVSKKNLKMIAASTQSLKTLKFL